MPVDHIIRSQLSTRILNNIISDMDNSIKEDWLFAIRDYGQIFLNDIEIKFLGIECRVFVDFDHGALWN